MPNSSLRFVVQKVETSCLTILPVLHLTTLGRTKNRQFLSIQIEVSQMMRLDPTDLKYAKILKKNVV